MLLNNLISNISISQIVGSPELVEIKRLSLDSRENLKNSVFFAIKGYKTDGHKFIQQAISNGAAAVVMQEDNTEIDQLLSSNNVVKILVENSRRALSSFANTLYEMPSKKMNLIGITGTKGKTTISYFIKTILDISDKKSGLIGTNNNMIGNEVIATKLTTPEAHVINELMQNMVNADCTYCIMEVSSHALELFRVADLDFNVAVFSNITSDHLDFHSTFESYLEAKKILFDQLNENSIVVYNVDDSHYKDLLKDCKAKKVSYSINSNADLKIDNVNYSLDGTEFNLMYQNKTYNVNTKLIGQFNAYNAAAAIGATIYSNVSIENAIEGISKTKQVPGRFEVLSSQNKKVIVDYSHTADSLEKALMAIRHIINNNKKIYTVFGCGGDRDKLKRPIMGEIAGRLSDFTYITSDNPRTENPFTIIKEIESGLQNTNYQVIEDRGQAIKTAIENAEDDSVILIAGKGHENYQEINGVRSYFSDKETAEKYL